MLHSSEVDNKYKALKCHIQFLDKDDDKFREVKEHVIDNQVKSKDIEVLNVFGLKREVKKNYCLYSPLGLHLVELYNNHIFNNRTHARVFFFFAILFVRWKLSASLAIFTTNDCSSMEVKFLTGLESYHAEC